MDENNPSRKEAITSERDERNRSLIESGGGTSTDENEETSTDTGITLGRRSVMAAVGTVAASLTGLASVPSSSAQMSSFSTYGFGGAPIVQRSSQPVTVTESESNDRQATAQELQLGSEVSGSLTQSDSDYYAVEMSAGDELAIEFDRTAATGLTAVIVFTADGDLGNIRYVSSDEPLVFTETVEKTGTQYVQVVDAQNSATDYTLTLSSGGDETETTTPTETETTTPVDDYGQQNYGQYGYGGVSLEA